MPLRSINWTKVESKQENSSIDQKDNRRSIIPENNFSGAND